MSGNLVVIEWLQAQSEYPKVLFSDGSKAVAGCGVAAEPGEFLFGGKDFFPFERKSPLWEKFPSSYFFSPKKVKEGEIKGEKLVKLLPERIIHSPPFGQYASALEELLGSDLKKAVFARKTTLCFDKAVDPFTYLRHLVGKGNLFFFQIDSETTFLGASPEWLFRRNERSLSTAAVAGTRPRGNGKKLLESKKDLEEFGFVQEEIARTLDSLCDKLSYSREPEILQTPHVEHLYTGFSAQIKENISDFDLMEALHPTPATGGVPKKAALKKIYEQEGFDRGWYAAPIGFMCKERADFLVAIRSALIVKNELHLFAGSGIVGDSKNYDEWNELNNKILLWII